MEFQQLSIPCPKCKGNGVTFDPADSGHDTCAMCNGTGEFVMGELLIDLNLDDEDDEDFEYEDLDQNFDEDDLDNNN